MGTIEEKDRELQVACIPQSIKNHIEEIRELCKDKQPLVVVSSLAYNHREYIKDALDGFVKQKTDFPFVVIIHDDASTDGTDKIIRQYAEKYPNIILPIFEKENLYSRRDGSVLKIMNAACDATGAEYIAFCEGDDYWIDPLKLQKQVDFLKENRDYGMVYSDFNRLYQNTGELQKACIANGYIPRIDSFDDMLVIGGYITPPSWLLYRTLYTSSGMLGAVDGSFSKALDFYAQTKVKRLDYVTCVYRVHNTSVTHTKTLKQVMRRMTGMLEIRKHYIKKYSVAENVANTALMRSYEQGFMCALASNDVKFLEEACSFLRHSPSYIYRWMALAVQNSILRCVLVRILRTMFRLKGYSI